MTIGGTRVHLCGRLAVEIGGEGRETVLPGRQGRLLFAYLTLNRHRPVRRDELLDVLWSDGTAPDRAESLLAAPLSRLRKALAPAGIEGREELTLQLGPGAWVDWDALGDHLAATRGAIEGRNWAEVAERAEAALAIADRGLLPGLEADWIEERRAELGDTRLEALEALARSGLHDGGAALPRAEEAARSAVEAAPFRESARVALIDALCARGNKAEALRAFEDARTLFRDELGAVPGPGLMERHESLLAGETDRRPSPAPPAPASTAEPGLPDRLAQVAASPWVGRRKHLERLQRELELAAAGETRLALITGEGGIGKTRLLAALAAEADGFTVLYGRCDEEELVPFGPWVEALGNHLAGVPDEDLAPLVADAAPHLTRLLPELAARLPESAEPAPSDPESERRRLFVGIAAVLGRLAQRRPVLAIVDDLHWADRSSLLLGRHLVRSGSLGPVLMLGSYRDTELEPGHPLSLVLADLEQDRPIDRLALAGLGDDEVAELARTQGQDLAPAAARAIRDETRGNPLFAKHLLRHIDEGGERHPEGFGVSAGIRDVIGRRVARLPEGSERALTVAALIGRDFELGLLADVVELPEDELIDLLDAAVRAGVLEETAGAPGQYSFVHALVRRALEDGLTATRRALIHRRIGEAIESRDRARLDARAGDLARHFLAAGPEDADRAITYAVRAAEGATARFAYEDAAEFLAGAVAARERDEPVDDADLSRLLRLLAASHLRAGRREEARATHARAAQAARRGGSPEAFARAALGHGGGLFEHAGVHDTETIALLREALDLLPAEDSRIRAQVIAGLSATLYWSNERAETLRDLANEAIAMAERLDDDEALTPALLAAQFAYWHPGDAATRRELGERFIGVAERRGDEKAAADAYVWMAMTQIELADIDGVESSVARHAEIAARLQMPEMLIHAATFRASRALIAGDWDAVERNVAMVRTIAGESMVGDVRQFHALPLFCLYSEQLRFDEFIDELAEIVAENPTIPAWRTALIWALVQTGREEEARNELATIRPHEFAALPRDINLVPALAVLANVAYELGDLELAAEIEPLLRPYVEDWVIFGAASNLGPVAAHIGLTTLLLGDLDQAESDFELALAKGEAMRSRPYIAYGSWGLSEIERRGDRAEDAARAAELRERAAEIVAELDMPRLRKLMAAG